MCRTKGISKGHPQQIPGGISKKKNSGAISKDVLGEFLKESLEKIRQESM